MMKNLTITLDDDTLEKARLKAASRKISVSRYVGEVVRKDLGHDDAYEAAYRAWRSEKPWPLKGAAEPYPKREELYDRPVLRRR